MSFEFAASTGAKKLRPNPLPQLALTVIAAIATNKTVVITIRRDDDFCVNIIFTILLIYDPLAIRHRSGVVPIHALNSNAFDAHGKSSFSLRKMRTVKLNY